MEFNSGYIIVFATFIVYLSIVTLCTFDTWQTVLLTMVCLMIAVYVFLLGVDNLTPMNVLTVKEGFKTEKGETESKKSKYEW